MDVALEGWFGSEGPSERAAKPDRFSGGPGWKTILLAVTRFSGLRKRGFLQCHRHIASPSTSATCAATAGIAAEPPPLSVPGRPFRLVALTAPTEQLLRRER